MRIQDKKIGKSAWALKLPIPSLRRHGVFDGVGTQAKLDPMSLRRGDEDVPTGQVFYLPLKAGHNFPSLGLGYRLFRERVASFIVRGGVGIIL